jgi:hypothetical protein
MIRETRRLLRFFSTVHKKKHERERHHPLLPSCSIHNHPPLTHSKRVTHTNERRDSGDRRKSQSPPRVATVESAKFGLECEGGLEIRFCVWNDMYHPF